MEWKGLSNIQITKSNYSLSKFIKRSGHTTDQSKEMDNTTDNNEELSPLTTNIDNHSSLAVKLHLPRNLSSPELLNRSPKSCLKPTRNDCLVSSHQLPNPVSRSNYPIFIPVDQVPEQVSTMGYQRNKSRKLKTKQERVYIFLEHPGGWMGFAYHMSV